MSREGGSEDSTAGKSEGEERGFTEQDKETKGHTHALLDPTADSTFRVTLVFTFS